MASTCSLVGYPMFRSHPYCGYSAAIFLIYSSLQVLASTDAAAMEENVASPFTTHVKGMLSYSSHTSGSFRPSSGPAPAAMAAIYENGRNLFPSISKCSGLTFRDMTARCMAAMDAFRMFIVSISSALASRTENDMASFSITGRSFSLSPADIFFESSRSGWRKSGGRITAAANTGPASGPLPASSQPASTTPSFMNGRSSGCVFMSESLKSVQI